MMEIVADLMSKDIVCIDVDGRLIDAISLMRGRNIGAIVIMENDNAVGIFTERDLLLKLDLSDDDKLSEHRIRDVMTKDLIMVDHQADYSSVINLMREKRIRHTPVYRGGKVVGMVSLRDLAMHYEDHLRYIIEKNNEQLLETLNQVKKSEAYLERTVILKTEFAQKVSHELRTPLTSIKGALDLVIRGKAGALTNDQLNFLSKAKKNVDRLKHLIDDVLDLAKLEAGRVVLDIQHYEINKVIEEIVESQQISIEQKGLYLNFDFDSHLPKIPFDRDNISQVICNLLSNSTKFTQNGGITIVTEYLEDKKCAQVTIKDTGRGISQDKTNQLFEKFRRLGPKTKSEPSGTGLGLAICKEIIEQHGGKIWAESEEGKGSHFHFILPIQRQEQRKNDGE